MFENITKALKELQKGVSVQVKVALDDDGYLDRLCPNQECQSGFKVLFDHWRDKVRDEAAYCPICRLKTAAADFEYAEQAKYVKQAGVHHVKAKLAKAIAADAKKFNSSQPRKSFIKLSAQHKSRPLPEPVCFKATEVMTQQSSCEECGCRYASIGSAFFCPACGHNSAVATFDGAVATIRKSLKNVVAIETMLAKAENIDAAKDFTRELIENNLQRLVASFQRFAEALFDKHPKRACFTVPTNAFQRITQSSDLWRQAIGVGYVDMLASDEFDDLTRLFQQRHLLAHREGIVDQKYIERSGDNSYGVGQKLVVRKKDVSRLADLVEQLAAELTSRT